MLPAIGAALITGGAGLLGSFLGSNSAQQANEQMMAFNREEAEERNCPVI